MTMVQKMARAMAEAVFGIGCPVDDENRQSALAALMVMREPTDAMLAGAASSESHKLIAKAFWQAMIDAAILEQNQ